ncbi:hypothetical protein QE152_g866 [Popillia japonica]|uniref:Uncharacterized protein n=1 Tax=Popillia japonica TaxID=7064 RepID=A0AAW1N4C6_POPJA
MNLARSLRKHSIIVTAFSSNPKCLKGLNLNVRKSAEWSLIQLQDLEMLMIYEEIVEYAGHEKEYSRKLLTIYGVADL